jgi:hypothetical protein
VSRPPSSGFSILEATIGALLFVLLLLGFLAVFDSAARLNKSEIATVEAQGSLRYALDRISRIVRMAGAGGLFVAQSVLVRPDPGVEGIALSGDGDFDNIDSGSITDLSGRRIPIRPGTDLLDVRGVILSPLFGFDETTGCGSCRGVAELTVGAVTARGHVNNDGGSRPRFSEVDSYTQGVSSENPMFVIAAAADDLHGGCPPSFTGRTLPPQPSYAVGKLASPTALARAGSFGWIDFGDAVARELTTENPDEAAASSSQPLPAPLARAGIVDDVLFFVDDSDRRHPVLAQGVRRGARFDVFPVAENVADMQVAYGVDGLYAGDGWSADGSIGRLVPSSEEDPDPEVSVRKDGDEWAPNAPGERLFGPTEFQHVQPAPSGFWHDGSSSSAHCPVLKALMISVVVRSGDPDPSYRGRRSSPVRTMNAPEPVSDSTGPERFNRYGRTIKINLRNFGLDG